MRPIRLKLSGMHSYRELQEVDFEMLCQAGLFGIFGPTGSGKSTILDAITLALYGQVVRLGGGNHPKEVLNQLEQRVFVSFTFELGKGDDRKQYTVEREFGLDKKGNKRQPEVRLIQSGALTGEPDVVLESKATMATAAIESLIGLTLQDFTRAVVLPQGQFSRFLTLKGSERNEMLQRMFRLHIYGEKLSERVRHALEQAKEQMHRLQLEAAALGDAGYEALAAARQTWAEAAQKEQEYVQQKLELSGKLKTMEQLYQWQQELARVREQLQDYTARQPEIELWKTRIRGWESSVRLWPLVQQWERLEQEWLATGQAVERSREEQESARVMVEAAELEYRSAQSVLLSQEPDLALQKGRLAQAEEWEAELAQIREEWTSLERERSEIAAALTQTEEQLARDEEALQVWEQEWKRLDEQMKQAAVTPEWRDQVSAAREAKQQWERERAKRQELADEVTAAEQQLQEAAKQAQQQRVAWEASAQRLETAKQQLAAPDAQPVLTDSEWEHARTVLNDMKQIGRQWRELLQQKADWQEKWERFGGEQKQAESRWKDLQAESDAKESVAAEQQTLFNELRETLDRWQQENMARYLRERLVDGEECPVCGATHHKSGDVQHPGQEEVRSEGDELRSRSKAAEEALREAERQARLAKEALLTAKGEQSSLEERLTALKQERESLLARLDALKKECSGYGETWAVDSFDELLGIYQREEKELAAKQAERERQREQREKLAQQIEVLREEEAGQKRLLERSTLIMEQLDQSIAEGKKRLQLAEEKLQRAAEELDAKRKDMLIDEIDGSYEEIGRRDRQMAGLQSIRAEKEQLRGTLMAQCDTAKARRSEWKLRESAVGEKLSDRKRMWEQKHVQWLERTGGQPARERLQQVEEALASLRQAVADAEEKRTQSAAVRESVQNNLVKHTEAFAVLTRQRSEAHEALQHALLESGMENVEQVRQLYAELGQLQEAVQLVEAYDKARDQLRYDEERLVQSLDGRSITAEEFMLARQEWEAWEQNFQEVQKQVAVAKEQVDRMEGNHEKWLALQKELEEQQDEQSRLEELKKLFEAKAFVQFIAEEKLASIARDASYHLKKMTANRYALEIGDEGEFVLRDEAAGGMRRPVSTLSGGETFLTSLSLALALSMEIQMRGGRLEFFFLDEGFGTLDPELLEVVMDALERLRMDDFTIGVISHVPEIRVRMPRRLVVTPAEPMGAGSKLHLEME
ncbi:AAA family ATPase [Brevibacillus choshinensis]|uniref:Nuclease SbcCD subunit C n=1 Tax=Brevibacillus choshinensis TaxID=54911 RepID=A0ABX7FLD8_BRECH|nr:SMC family ATPase [Brevibacillus choshinensis]QRG67066.1 SMC family ATPase [Brevibacillus choshinensis]